MKEVMLQVINRIKEVLLQVINRMKEVMLQEINKINLMTKVMWQIVDRIKFNLMILAM